MSTFLLLFFIFSNWKTCSGIFLTGTRVKEGQFPWLIQFKTVVPCGGVLLSPDWVLTAAQCVQANRQSILLQAAGLNGTKSVQVIRVLHAYIHPEYNIKYNDHDHNIALIKLVKPFDVCDSKVRFLDVAPVKLDENYKSCLIFGWQSYVEPTSKVFAKPIQYSQVLLNAWKYCIYMHEGNSSLSNVFCTMIEAKSDIKACAGNPGTPVVCEDQSQRMVLLGIASWTKFSLDCGGLPSYLSVSIFSMFLGRTRSWIYELIINVRNSENQEKYPEITNAACKHEHAGGINTEVLQDFTYLLQTNKKLRANEIRELLDEARKLKFINETKKGSFEENIDFISSPTSKSGIPIFGTLNDHTMILKNEDYNFLGNVEEREENLRQYQEIGLNSDNEAIGNPEEHSESTYIRKPSLKEVKDEYNTEEIEILDNFEEDIFPFILDEYHSSAFLNSLCSKYILILYLSFLHVWYR